MNIRFSKIAHVAMAVMFSYSFANAGGCNTKNERKATPGIIHVTKTVLPVQLINGLPYINITINGSGPYLVGFDSGFGGEMELDTELATELGIHPTGTTSIGDGSGNNEVTLNTGVASKVQMGNETLSAVHTIIRDNTRKKQPGMENVKGIIGIGMFPKHLVTIDYPGLQLTIETGDLPSANEKDIFGYKPVGGGIPQISIKIGNYMIPAIIDSRSMSAEFKIPQTIADKLTKLGEPRIIGKGRTISSVIDVIEVKIKESIQMGQYVYNEPVITYPSLNESAIIGSKLLKKFKITIDSKNQLVRLSKGDEPKASSHLTEYTGSYAGGRVITAEGEFLYIQRGSGTVLKMLPKGKDEFTIEIVPNSVLQFERGDSNKITAIKVSKGDGNWETATKER